MAKGSKSSAKKPRKKSKLLTFRTPQEKRQLKLKQNSASSLLTPSKHGTDAVSVTSIGKTANNKITISTPKKSQERKRDRESDNLSSSKKNSSEISMDAQNNETRKKTMNATPINANNDKAGTMKERKRNTPEISQVMYDLLEYRVCSLLANLWQHLYALQTTILHHHAVQNQKSSCKECKLLNEREK